MSRWATGEIISGVWRFEQPHPAWGPEDDDWAPEVASWAVETEVGLVLIDPFESDGAWVEDHRADVGEVAAVIRTRYWHQRSCTEVAARHGVDVWALPAPKAPQRPLDCPLVPGRHLPAGLVAFAVDRFDEIALWSPSHRALFFGDVILRNQEGAAMLCPEDWLDPIEGPQRIRKALAPALTLPVEHLLVSHGKPVTGGGLKTLCRVIQA